MIESAIVNIKSCPFVGERNLSNQSVGMPPFLLEVFAALRAKHLVPRFATFARDAIWAELRHYPEVLDLVEKHLQEVGHEIAVSRPLKVSSNPSKSLDKPHKTCATCHVKPKSKVCEVCQLDSCWQPEGTASKKADKTLPKCFGEFNENSLDCTVQNCGFSEDCEEKTKFDKQDDEDTQGSGIEKRGED